MRTEGPNQGEFRPKEERRRTEGLSLFLPVHGLRPTPTHRRKRVGKRLEIFCLVWGDVSEPHDRPGEGLGRGVKTRGFRRGERRTPHPIHRRTRCPRCDLYSPVSVTSGRHPSWSGGPPSHAPVVRESGLGVGRDGSGSGVVDSGGVMGTLFPLLTRNELRGPSGRGVAGEGVDLGVPSAGAPGAPPPRQALTQAGAGRPSSRAFGRRTAAGSPPWPRGPAKSWSFPVRDPHRPGRGRRAHRSP